MSEYIDYEGMINNVIELLREEIFKNKKEATFLSDERGKAYYHAVMIILNEKEKLSTVYNHE